MNAARAKTPDAHAARVTPPTVDGQAGRADRTDATAQPKIEFESEVEAILGGLPQGRGVRRVLRDLEDLVLHEGFLTLTTSDIASRLKCSKSTLYQLAPTAEGLVELVVALWLARAFDASRQSAATAENFSERLKRFLDAPAVASIGVSYTFLRDLRASPTGARLLRTFHANRESFLEQVISDGIAASECRPVDPRLAAQLLSISGQSLADPDFMSTLDLSLREAAQQTWALFEYGLIRTP